MSLAWPVAFGYAPTIPEANVESAQSGDLGPLPQNKDFSSLQWTAEFPPWGALATGQDGFHLTKKYESYIGKHINYKISSFI